MYRVAYVCSVAAVTRGTVVQVPVYSYSSLLLQVPWKWCENECSGNSCLVVTCLRSMLVLWLRIYLVCPVVFLRTQSERFAWPLHLDTHTHTHTQRERERERQRVRTAFREHRVMQRGSDQSKIKSLSSNLVYSQWSLKVRDRKHAWSKVWVMQTVFAHSSVAL